MIGSNFNSSIQAVPSTLLSNFMDGWRTTSIRRSLSLRRDKDGKPLLHTVARLDKLFAGYRAYQIEADLIRKFIADQQGRGLANGTINRSVSALRRMFKLSVKEKNLRQIPYFPMVKEPPPRQGFFGPAQYEELSRALLDCLRLPLALGYFTGMRAGEIFSLEWSQVDFLAGIINLRAGETKNDEARTIPFVPQLRRGAPRAARQTPAALPVCLFPVGSEGPRC